MLLVPIAAGRSRPALPPVTTAIIVLCLAVQAWRSAVAPSDEEMMAALVARAEAERAVLQENDLWVPRLEQAQYERGQRFLESFRAGEVRATSPAVVRRLQEADARVAALEAQDPAYLLGYRPVQGLSPRMLTAAFAHGGWAHFFSNMVFLWLVGAHVELLWGARLFSALYVLGALGATLTSAALHRGEKTLFIGASGAVFATIAAYYAWWFKSEMRFWYVFWWPGLGLRTGAFGLFTKALFLLPAFLVNQFTLTLFETWKLSQGTAFSGHAGGIVTGLGVALWVRLTGKAPLPRTTEPTLDEERAARLDADVTRAAELLTAGGALEAARLLESVLHHDPHHARARRGLLKTALVLGRRDLAEQVAGDVFVAEALGGNAKALPQLYRRLEQQLPGIDLGERAQLELVRHAAQAGDDALAVEVAQRFVQQRPGSPAAPRVLWELAALHARAGRAAQERAVLEQLLAAHPADPIADHARRRLRA